MRSVLGSVGSRRRSTTSTALLDASAFGLQGYVDTLSPLVAMLLLDRSCVIVGKFFLKNTTFPNRFRTSGQVNFLVLLPPSLMYLTLEIWAHLISSAC